MVLNIERDMMEKRWIFEKIREYIDERPSDVRGTEEGPKWKHHEYNGCF